MGLDSLEQLLKNGLRPLGLLHEVNWILNELQPLPLEEAKQRAEYILARRMRGEPLAYILGHWDFRKLTLSVGPGVLIPRPETEELVDHALRHIEKAVLAQKTPTSPFRVADLGSGTGAIAYSLLSESKEEIHVTAVEKSPEAFGYLNKNKNVLSDDKKSKIDLRCSDWSDLGESSFDLIVSNPPYVSFEEYQSLEGSVKEYEPRAALVPNDGSSEAERVEAFSAYESIFQLAQRTLAPGGALLLEFGPAQEALWTQKMPNEFRWEIFKDLSGKPRILYAFDFLIKNR